MFDAVENLKVPNGNQVTQQSAGNDAYDILLHDLFAA